MQGSVSVNLVLQSRHQCLSQALSHETIDPSACPSRDALYWKMKMKVVADSGI